MRKDRGNAEPRQQADPAAAGAKPVRLGVYDRPAAGGRHALYLALAVIVAAVIAWLLFAHRGAAAAPLALFS
jgi:hypothetical protein